jgi:hypothetical protein
LVALNSTGWSTAATGSQCHLAGERAIPAKDRYVRRSDQKFRRWHTTEIPFRLSRHIRCAVTKGHKNLTPAQLSSRANGRPESAASRSLWHPHPDGVTCQRGFRLISNATAPAADNKRHSYNNSKHRRRTLKRTNSNYHSCNGIPGLRTAMLAMHNRRRSIHNSPRRRLSYDGLILRYARLLE